MDKPIRMPLLHGESWDFQSSMDPITDAWDQSEILFRNGMKRCDVLSPDAGDG